MKAHPLDRWIKRLLPTVLVGALMTVGVTQWAAPAHAAVSLINPAASAEARELYSYLQSINGQKMITGQHDYLETPDELNNRLKKISGEYAGLHGYELGAISGQTASQAEAQRSKVVESAIRWHQAGGIVAMTYHQPLPGKPMTWANVQAKLSQSQFDRYVTPGTQEYSKLIADLDQVAVSLKKLSDEGVPVLWRPYHEMNGSWFWWGKKNNFDELWDLMYDRFVRVHKLDNLIWVWNPNAPNTWSDPYATTFPGLTKVDVLAADIYDNDYKQRYYEELLALAGNKPIAIGEHGEMPSARVLESQPRWTYSMTWGKMLLENNTEQDIVHYMEHERTLTRDELQEDMEGNNEAPTPTLPPQDPGTSEGNPSLPEEPIASPPSPAPEPQPEPEPELINGLYGEYFNNMTLSGDPVLRRLEAKLDYNWRTASPDPAVQADRFSARWTGRVSPRFTDVYTFTTISDDGIRVWVNDQLIIDSWFKQSWTERKGSIALNGGELYDLKVEYYDQEGDAMARLMWESQQEAKAVIPSNALFLPLN